MQHTTVPDVSTLAASFSGRLVAPGDADYDTVRTLHNGLANKRPALIARCLGASDVREALAFARALKLEIAVRGGGHNVSGRASVDGGVMIDLSLMKGIHVDPRARTARAQGGVTWGEFNRETQAHGLATTGGVVSSTGIAGLTLGGGLGWLLGKCGYSVDNLLSVQIVTADGQILNASEAEHPDLFWALRGGGGNFGVAVSFEYRLHQIGPTVTAGIVAHPFSATRDVMRFYRDFTAALPDELTAFAGMIHGPDGSKLVAMVVCHCGSLADGDAAVSALRRFGSPVMDTIGPMPYTAVNTLFDASLPRGALNYWKSHVVESLTDDVIEVLIDSYSRCPSAMGQLFMEHVYGAATRVATDATAFPFRSPGYNLLFLSQWADPADTAACIEWARRSYAALEPLGSGLRYVNYLDDDEGADPAAEAYGSNYRRLQRIKARYDPENVFHLNQNIRPVAGA